jgi:hypothetical protein
MQNYIWVKFKDAQLDCFVHKLANDFLYATSHLRKDLEKLRTR